jgi:NTE family protein
MAKKNSILVPSASSFISITSTIFFSLLTVAIFSTGCSELTTRSSPAYKNNHVNSAGHTKDAKDLTGKDSDGRDDFGNNGSDKTNLNPPAIAPSDKAEKKVAVILGPGGYKTFAHAGVLKELKRKSIPINKIVGIEWGALVAGLFAQRGQINEAEWKLYKLEKLDLSDSGFFSSKNEAQSVKVLDSFLHTNLDLKDVSQAAVPFFCPSLALNQGAMTWQESGPIAKMVENCLPSPPLYKPIAQNVAGLFSIDDVISRLKNEGFNVIILVNVLGDGILFDNPARKEDYATAVLWNEARRQIWQAKSRVTDTVEVNTKGIRMSDFDSRKMLVTAGEAAGERSAADIVSKYGF